MSSVVTPIYPKHILCKTKPPMFTFLLSSVVLAGGTYFLYHYLFGEPTDEEKYGYGYNKNQAQNAIAEEEEEEDESGVKMRIFFGSQSGTAEGFAFDMEKEAKQYGFSAKAVDLEDYDPNNLCDEKLCIFLVATYGEGEPTDNAQEFYTWLTSEDRFEVELSNVQFAVFGLGNSQYEFFNAMGKQFDDLLQKYGATRLFDRGEGDDDVGSIEDQFGEWKEKLYPLLCSKYLDLAPTLVRAISADNGFKCSLNVQFMDDLNDVNYQVAKSVVMPYDYSNYIGKQCDQSLFLPSRNKPYSSRIGICKMLKIEQLRQNTKDGSTLHIDFDLQPDKNTKNPLISYQTADNMGFLPRNSYKKVAKLCKRLGFDSEQIISITPSDESVKANYTFPQIVSIKNLFLWFLDINGSPGKKLLSLLANNFTQSDDESKEILKLCEDIQENVVSAHLSLYDVIMKYESIQIDIASLIELLKPLQPRLYTIASSSMINPKTVSICIKLEEEKKSNFFGVQSAYLNESKVGNFFQFYMESSKFKLPSPSTPVITISVGAGLAPFAAFVDEGNEQIAKNENKKEYGEWIFFFGCRYSNGDYIYKEKMEKALKDENGVLDELKCAFSRDQEKKVYVQHLIAESKEKLWTLINEKNARIYVCGGVAMGRSVREAFTNIFSEFDENKDGHGYLDKMLKADIYVQELWG